MNVLVVDDQEFNLKVIDYILRKSFKDVSVDLAKNGKIAVKKASDNSYSLILMDINMPVMDGVTACQLIKYRDLSQAIVAVTAEDIGYLKKEQKLNSFDYVLQKPLNEKSLVETIELFVSKN